MYSDLRSSHESLIDDHNNLKSIVVDILKVSPIYENMILQKEMSNRSMPGMNTVNTNKCPPTSGNPPSSTTSTNSNIPTVSSTTTVTVSRAPARSGSAQSINGNIYDYVPPMPITALATASKGPVTGATARSGSAQSINGNIYDYVPPMPITALATASNGPVTGATATSSATNSSYNAPSTRPVPVIAQQTQPIPPLAPTTARNGGRPAIVHPNVGAQSQGVAKGNRGPSDKPTSDQNATNMYAFPPNPNKDRRGNDKKRPETPIESFLKEAKRVMPNPQSKRTPANNQKPHNEVAKRMTSTPSISNQNPKPIALSNMFATLDSLDPDSQALPPREQVKQPRPNEQIDITSPEHFPRLPGSGETSHVNAQMNEHPRENDPQPGPAEESWAEIVDEEDNKTIEAFLATVENKDIPSNPDRNHHRGGPRASTPINPPHVENKAVNQNRASGSNPIPQRNRHANAPFQNPKPNSANQMGTQTQKPAGRGATGGLPKPNTDVRPKTGPGYPDQARDHPDRVVTRNGWHTKKRKHTKSSSVTFPTICGGYTKPFRDIFVGNLRNDLYNDPADMSDALQDFCEERGVGVYSIRILSSQFEGFSNAKITVATIDYQTVIDKDFWPENVSVREWYQGGNDKKSANAGPKN